MRLDEEWRPPQSVDVEMYLADGERIQLWTMLSAVRGPDGEPVYLGYGPAGRCLAPQAGWMRVRPSGVRTVVMIRPAPCGHLKFLAAEQTMN